MAALQSDVRFRLGRWVLIGALMGVVAGLVFGLFQIIVAALTLGPPPRELLLMVEGVVLGPEAVALDPAATSIASVAVIALIIHLVLSAIYGAVFGAIASKVRALHDNPWALIGAATVFGLLIWIVNFYVIAPLAFPWFAEANAVVQFFAHTLFFGTVLGLLLALATTSAPKMASARR
jgi:hypothetical protein